MAKDNTEQIISENLRGFQSTLKQGGTSMHEYMKESYHNKWFSDSLYACTRIKTTFVSKLHEFLYREGLLNLERISFSLLTDPLAHDVEHTPTINYKGQTYVTTHSMIYHKFLACHNPKIKGIYVDSPNVRLELEDPLGRQRGKYLVDFNQMDIEIRRNRGISLEEYYDKKDYVEKILKDDMENAINFFERMLIYSLEGIIEKNEDDLNYLGVAIEAPKSPFPRFKLDDLTKRYNTKELEVKIGEETTSQFFWITGLLRENYDLVYPYLSRDGRVPLNKVTSDMIYNYDICAKSIIKSTGKSTPAKEILSGAIREWLYEPIIERLIDNKIISVRPIIKDGNIENINELGGYGPFLMSANMKNKDDKPSFPDTYGGGIGIERTMYSILRGPKVAKIDEVTFFGKNPDSSPLYLF
ncbi:MAG: hypothetical protein KAT05_07085 [Spirochaetes bacterium]|nr:hypothetical protein [Spirochaetota bacterium]